MLVQSVGARFVLVILICLAQMAAFRTAPHLAARPGSARGPAQVPPETVLLADDFNLNAIDGSKWVPASLFSGLTDNSLMVADSSQQLRIGPLKQAASGSHYNGLRSAAMFDFTGAYCYVQIVTAPPGNTAADAMLTIGPDVNNYYRIYIESGNLIVQRKVAGAKAVLLSQPYDAAMDSYVRIRHDVATGSVLFEVASDNAGVPGPWSRIYTEPWNSAIALTSVLLELKAGTWQAEANPAGTVVFDNFKAAKP